jgi:hypothetical protein
MEDLTNRNATLAALSAGALCVVLAFITGSPVAIVAASFLFLCSLVLWKYGYLVMPWLFKNANIVELRSGHEIPASQDVVLKKGDGRYYASVFLAARISDSMTEKDRESKSLYMEYFERAISSIRFPVKFCAMTAGLDISSFSDEIKGRRSLAETRKARILSSGDQAQMPEVARLDREIAMWDRQLERLNSEERPMEVLCYLMTTASGAGREEATARARAQASEVRSAIGNALNVEIAPLAGEEMRKCFDWELAMPASLDEMRDSVF